MVREPGNLETGEQYVWPSCPLFDPSLNYSVLKEHSCKQVPGEPPRRWISDDYFDLIVWGEASHDPIGFQLCYDKPGRERALTWTAKGGFSHAAVDGGEACPTANRTPILVADGLFPDELVKRQFLWRSEEIDTQRRGLVLKRLDEYSASRATELPSGSH